MKKKIMLKGLLAVSIAMILFVSTGAIASTQLSTIQDTPASDPQSEQLSDDYTHTALVEAGTATWCPPCATAAQVMHDIFYSGQYDFYYVALVSDKNTYADQRCGELGVSSIPDYIFDGGFTRWVGSGGLPYAYTTRLDQSGARTVEDIDLGLDITWLENGQIGVDLNIQNNEASAYNGHLHVYVTEIESRWNTYNQRPYHFAMVGNYAFNENINIPSGEISEHSTVWDGSLYGVGDIQEENVMVIATVFNSANNLYSDATAAKSFVDLFPPELELDITGSFGKIQATLKNNGTTEITDIEWRIDVTGGILGLIDVSSEGIIDSLPIGDETTIETDRLIFGLGQLSISVHINLWEKTAQGFIFGPLVLL